MTTPHIIFPRSEMPTPQETPAPLSELRPVRSWAIRSLDAFGRLSGQVTANYEAIERANLEEMAHTDVTGEDDPDPGVLEEN